jgi:PAP2 superfamily
MPVAADGRWARRWEHHPSPGGGSAAGPAPLAECRLILTEAKGFLCCLAFAMLLPSGTAASNEVTDWNVIIESAAKASSSKPGILVSARNVSLMHLAMHNALNAINQRYATYGLEAPAPSANAQAAVIAAGHGVAVRLYPDQRSSLDDQYHNMLATVPDSLGKNQGLALGDEAAARVIDSRANDQFYEHAKTESFVCGKGPYRTGPGAWFPSVDAPHQDAVFPRASLIVPLALTSPSQFRSLLPGPPKLSSGIYLRDFEEVKALGSVTSTWRTPDQTAIGKFWSDRSLFRTFNEVSRNLISARGDDFWDSTRTLALLNLAVVDSYVAVFDAKYQYQFWRPTMAIREANADDNEKTTSDPNWLPLVAPTPPFPEYPSGHSGACGSAQIILESAFGRNTPFTATGVDELPNYARKFGNFDEMARECVEGRMLSGHHFRFSNEDALYLGRHIGRYVLRTILDPVVSGSIESAVAR